LLSAQHALAAKKGMVAPPLVAPAQSLAPPGFMLAIFQWAGGIASLAVVLKLMLNNFKTDLNTEITAVKTDLTKEITAVTKEITAVKTDLTKEITAVKTELTNEITAVKTDLNTEITAVKTELTAVKTELTAVKTDLTKEITKVKTDIVEELSLMFATKLKEIHDDFKASSAAEVERQVKTEIADKSGRPGVGG